MDIKIFIGIVFVASFFLIQGVDAWPASMSNWGYRRQIQINMTAGGSETNYEVPINLTNNTNFANNWSDIRFMNNCSDDATLLNFCLGQDCDDIWTEDVDGDYAEVYVNVPVINTTICLYLNNDAGISASFANDTFTYHNDFESGSVATFSQTTANAFKITDGGQSTRDSYAMYRDNTVNANNRDTCWDTNVNVSTLPAFVTGYVITDFSGSGSWAGAALSAQDSNNWYGGGQKMDSNNESKHQNYRMLSGSGTADTDTGCANGAKYQTWYFIRQGWYTNGTFESNVYALDGTLYCSNTIAWTLFDWGYVGMTAVREAVIDDLRVRRTRYSDIPVYTIGDEEAAPVSNDAPQYSDVAVSPATGQTYPVANIQFNVTWIDPDGDLDVAWLTHNKSGTNTTIYMTNTSDNFSYQWNTPTAGVFYYWLSANDSTGATNTTEHFYYNIWKQAIEVNLTVNGTVDQAGYINATNVTYGNTTNLTASVTITGGNLTLTRNGTLIAYNSVFVDDVQTFGLGSYYYITTFTHENYSGSEYHYINVGQQPVNLYLYVNGTDYSPGTLPSFNTSYGNTTNITVWTDLPGANVTLARNGTVFLYNSTGTIIADIQNYGYGTHTFYAYTNNANYTLEEEYVFINVNKTNAGVTLTSSEGWNILEGQQTTITAGSIVTPLYLTRDGIFITNPYITTLGFGTYNFTAYTPDDFNYTNTFVSYELTVLPGGAGCTNSSTYAFSKNITNLSTQTMNMIDFSVYVADGTVRDDLKDVWTNDSVTFYTNFTGGYYIVANVTNVSSYTLHFGNYFSTNSYTNLSQVTNTSNLTSYVDEINPYYVFTIYEEMTYYEGLPPNTNGTYLTMYCANGSSTKEITNTTFLVSTFMTATDAYFNVYYTDSQYTRSYVLGGAAEYRDAYLTDATTYTVLQMPIVMFDFNYWDSEIEIYKLGASGEAVITEGWFDIQHVFDSYLIKDQRYYIRIKLGTETRDMGTLYPVAAEEIEISVSTVYLEPDIQIFEDYITLAAETNDTLNTLVIQYFDALNQTNDLRIHVYENDNQTALFDNTYYNTSNLTITINNINASHRFNVLATLNHTTFGNSPITVSTFAGAFGALANLGLATWVYSSISFVFILFVSMIAVPKIRFVSIILIGASIVYFAYLGWFTAGVGAIALLIVFIALSVIYEMRRGGMT